MQLNHENYYSTEADQAYMSYSQYKNFLRCESMALAKLRGWKPPESPDLLVGSYVHAWAEGEAAFEKFKQDNPDIFSSRGESKGQLKAPFQSANAMINTIANDRLMMLALEGEKEQIITAEFAGCLWKAKLDVIDRASGKITDLKTARSLSEKVWDNKNRVWLSFIEAYGYIGQMALYSELDRVATGRDYRFDTFMAIVTKEDPPDKTVITFPEWRLNDELEYIKNNMPRILAVKSGDEPPEECGKCPYCRETKQLHRVYDYDEIYDMYIF